MQASKTQNYFLSKLQHPCTVRLRESGRTDQGLLYKVTELVVGEPLARAFVNLLALGRSGWRESDLRVLLPQLSGVDWDPLQFARLRRTFRAHLVERGSETQWDFFHRQTRKLPFYL